MLLGDFVQRALSMVGITEERMKRLLGRDCGCKERKEMLNDLHRWGRAVLRGLLSGRMNVSDARRHFDETMEFYERQENRKW